MIQSIINYAWEIFINFSESFLFFIFINAKMHPQKNSFSFHRKQILFLFSQTALTCFCNFFNIPTLITVLLSLVSNIAFAVIFYINPFILKIFWGSIYSVICIFAEYITMLIPQTFSTINPDEMLAGGRLRIPMSLLYIALIAVFVFFSINIGSKKMFLTPIQKSAYVILCVLGIAVAHYILIVTLNVSHFYAIQKLTDSLILTNMFFLLLFIALLLFIYQLGVSKNQNMELIEQSKQSALEKQQYKNLLESTKALREIKHDIEIHLDIIQSLADTNDTAKLKEYITSYHNSIEQTHHLLSTGNTAIDCILSAKLSQAKKMNIKLNYSVLIPEPFPLDSINLSSLLGNLLDNALEACQRCLTAKSNRIPRILFYIKPYFNMVVIHIENTTDDMAKINSKHTFVSSKHQKGHGIGIKRIRSIVNDADGILNIVPEKNKFTVHIMLPLKEERDIEN